MSADGHYPTSAPIKKKRKWDWASLGAHAVLVLWAMITIIPDLLGFLVLGENTNGDIRDAAEVAPVQTNPG